MSKTDGKTAATVTVRLRQQDVDDLARLTQQSGLRASALIRRGIEIMANRDAWVECWNTSVVSAVAVQPADAQTYYDGPTVSL